MICVTVNTWHGHAFNCRIDLANCVVLDCDLIVDRIYFHWARGWTLWTKLTVIYLCLINYPKESNLSHPENITRIADPTQRENLGIIVQYKVKVKLCIGGPILGGWVICHLRFLCSCWLPLHWISCNLNKCPVDVCVSVWLTVRVRVQLINRFT